MTPADGTCSKSARFPKIGVEPGTFGTGTVFALLLILPFLLLNVSPVLAQSPDPALSSVVQLEHARKVKEGNTLYIQEDTVRPAGTAFFIRSGEATYAVTARHLVDTKVHLHGRLKVRDPATGEESEKYVIFPNYRWVHHPEEGDVERGGPNISVMKVILPEGAVVNTFREKDEAPGEAALFIGSENFIDGDQIFHVGYAEGPPSVFAEGKVVITGRTPGLGPYRFGGRYKKLHFSTLETDASVGDGYAGGPLLLEKDGQRSLIGLTLFRTLNRRAIFAPIGVVLETIRAAADTEPFEISKVDFEVVELLPGAEPEPEGP